ncbi:MAG TPA: ABC transporter substrate-binding protein [Rubricoccaceae bacterium]|nr:ABC transporter substrate-binding protein [Rubricoccaceae bacterium]
MRVVSLLPAATEWLFAFGLGDGLVGRSHACTFPPEAAALPAVTDVVEENGRPRVALDADALRALHPDLVVIQTTCAVCAVPPETIGAVLNGWPERRPAVFDFAPSTFKQTLDAALALARVAGCLPDAFPVVAGIEERLRALHRRLGYDRRTGTVDGAAPPSVVCIEWPAPLFLAAHWVPDLIEHAGGRPLGPAAGERSPAATWGDVRALDPDVLVLASCGRSTEEAMEDLAALVAQPGWSELRAVREGQAFALDGRITSGPGPRLVRAAEVLAAALHPERAGVWLPPEELRRVP